MQDGVGGERRRPEQARGLGERGEGQRLEEVGGAAGEADAAHLGAGAPSARTPEGEGGRAQRGELGQAQHPDEEADGHDEAGGRGAERGALGAHRRQAEAAADQQPAEDEVDDVGDGHGDEAGARPAGALEIEADGDEEDVEERAGRQHPRDRRAALDELGRVADQAQQRLGAEQQQPGDAADDDGPAQAAERDLRGAGAAGAALARGGGDDADQAADAGDHRRHEDGVAERQRRQLGGAGAAGHHHVDHRDDDEADAAERDRPGEREERAPVPQQAVRRRLGRALARGREGRHVADPPRIPRCSPFAKPAAAGGARAGSSFAGPGPASA